MVLVTLKNKEKKIVKGLPWNKISGSQTLKGGPRTSGHRHTEKYGPSLCAHPLKGGPRWAKTEERRGLGPWRVEES